MADAKKTTATPKVMKNAAEVKTIEQLRADLEQAQADHLDSRRSHKQGELVNPHVLTVQRKGIARLHTAIKATESAVKEEN